MCSPWPFRVEPNHEAFCRRSILEHGAAVLFVSHDSDGSWQFSDGQLIAEDETPAYVCLSHVYERDRSIGVLADLPVGWFAERSARGASWVGAPHEEPDGRGQPHAVILSGDGSHRVTIFSRTDGSFGFAHERYTGDRQEKSWAPCNPPQTASHCGSLDIAFREAIGRAPWLSAEAESLEAYFESDGGP